MKCSKREILSNLVTLLAPYAPHIAEELWHALGNKTSVCDAEFPVFNESYLVETAINYPISFNGKLKFTLQLPADMSKEEVEKNTLANEQTIKQLNGNAPKKGLWYWGK
jgi:leucyl-tRNA synthetase